MGCGGDVFKAPPENLTPTLDTPQAAKSARMVRQPADEVRAGRACCPTPTTRRCARRCRAAPTSAPRRSPGACRSPSTPRARCRRRCASALMPAGPRGNFPGSNSHGLGIPAGSKKKEAAWEFIKWALSKETIAMDRRRSTAIPASAGCSVIKSPEFKQVMTLNGQDVGSLYLEVLRARRQDRLHEVPHRAGLSAGRRQDQQGDRDASPPSSRAPPTP